MSTKDLLNRTINALHSFKHPATGCWCRRDEGQGGFYPADSHSVKCLDIQALEADILEELR